MQEGHEYRLRAIPEALNRKLRYIATSRHVAPNKVILDALQEYCDREFDAIVKEVQNLYEKKNE